MDIQKILLELFTFEDTQKATVFYALLFATFMLGVLLWTLFFHWPQRRRLRKENQRLSSDLAGLRERHEDLEKEHKYLDEKQKTTAQTLKETEAELLQKNEAFYQAQQALEEAKRILGSAQQTAENARNELNELKQVYKYQQHELRETEIQLEAAQAQKVEQQNLLEDLRQELNALGINFEQLQEQHGQACQELEDALAKLETLQALEQDLAELEIKAQSLETELKNRTTAYEVLRENLAQNQADMQALQDKLQVYVAQEDELKREDRELEAILEACLSRSAQALDQAPLFAESSIEEEELIEDAETLYTKLCEAGEEAKLPAPQEQLKLSAEEETELEAYRQKAKQALQQPGFFEDMDEAPFLAEDQAKDDETILAQYLEEAEAMLERSVLFNPIAEPELLEEEELAAIEAKLKTEPIEIKSRGLGENQTPAPDDLEDRFDFAYESSPPLEEADEELAERALKNAGISMSTEGFFQSPAPEKLIEVEGDEDRLQSLLLNPKYKTDLERSLALEIGRSLPRAEASARQDLQRLKGIDAFVEERLNHLGVYTYAQIAQLDADLIQKLGAVIGLGEGRIESQAWVEQAKALEDQT